MSAPVELGGPVLPGPLLGGGKLVVIAGPCVLEDEESAVRLAVDLARRLASRPVHPVFKASFDKANRTSHRSYRGPGVDAGLRMLGAIRRESGLPVLTDIHEPEQAEAAAAVVDVLQVPAFLCRQTDLLTAAARTGKPVNIKKGQFMAPGDMAHAVEKVVTAGGRAMLTERGTSFGYRDLVVDMRSLVWMSRLGVPVIFDGTHSVQQPGSGQGCTGGLREMVAPLVRAAVAVGVDGIYLEIHPDPDRAPSDGPNSLTPAMMESVVDEVVAIHECARSSRTR